MQMNMKILIAAALIIMACGVVGYNVQFLSERWKGDAETAPGDEAVWEEEIDAPFEVVERVNPFEAGTGAEPRTEGAPLGREWDNSLWQKLLDDYANKEASDGADQGKEAQSKEPLMIEIPVEGMTNNRVERFQDVLKGLKVTGILHGKGASSALINDGIYRVGDQVPGRRFVVAEIGKEFVLFRSLDHGGTVMKPLEPRGRKRGNEAAEQWEDGFEEDGDPLIDNEDG
jgi:hypothetical protein